MRKFWQSRNLQVRLGDEGWQQVICTLATGKGPTVLSLRDCWLDQEQVVVSFSIRPCLWSVALAKQVPQRCPPWRSCPTIIWVWRRGRSTITRSSWPGLSTLILLQLFELGSRACNNTTFENISYVQGSNWRKHIKLTQGNVEVITKVEMFITGIFAKWYSTYVYPTLPNLPRYGTLWAIMSVKESYFGKKMCCRETWWYLPIPRNNIRNSCIKSVSDKLGWNMPLGAAGCSVLH